MATKQNRIDGSYTIVSTHRPGRIDDSMAAIQLAWRAGLSVALMVGVWLGDKEESLMISGLGHAAVGRKLAEQYHQDAYIVVDSGLAVLHVFNGHTYVVGNVWSSMMERTTQDSYSVLPTGQAFVFAA